MVDGLFVIGGGCVMIVVWVFFFVWFVLVVCMGVLSVCVVLFLWFLLV